MISIVKEISFVLVNGVYKEVPTEMVQKNGKRTTEYQDRFLLEFGGYLMEVDEKDYREFVRDRRRQKYLKEEAELHGEFSYHSYDTDDYSGEELIIDVLTNVEDEVIRLQMMETVSKLVSELPALDKRIILSLFYDEKTVRQCATDLGIPKSVVAEREAKVLKRWKKILKI